MRRTAVLALSLTALVVMAACGGGGEATPAPAAVATPVNGVVQVTISERDIEPKVVSIKVGEEVTFQVTSENSYHTFTIEDADEQEIAHLRVRRDTTETAAVTIDQPGTYVFYCRVTGHRGFGEEGQLIVE
ncbi:MAG: cupredoxin domain-containing protein [Dehalococcoidia bacterium]